MRKQRLAQFDEACGFQAVQIEAIDVGAEGPGAGRDANMAVVGCVVVAGMAVDEFAHGGHSFGAGCHSMVPLWAFASCDSRGTH
ncbi:hypothetical protein D9M71_562560 [compost metagenome]